MADDLKTLANWAKELGLPEKQLKEAAKVSGIAPDAKKGACSYYSQATVQKLAKGIK